MSKAVRYGWVGAKRIQSLTLYKQKAPNDTGAIGTSTWSTWWPRTLKRVQNFAMLNWCTVNGRPFRRLLFYYCTATCPPRAYTTHGHDSYSSVLKKNLYILRKPRLPSALGLSGACGVAA
eukprot:scaffold9397_cov148-Isochrysis_galbana.AAC.4